MVSNGTGTFREGFATACILMSALFLGIVATGSTAQATNSLTLSEIDSTESHFDSESTTDVEPMDNSKTITEKIQDKPISKDNDHVDFDELPIALPEKSADAAAPVSVNETRIDALVMACGEGDFEFVKTLIIAGIDVNDIGSEGFTPLMMATSKDEAEIVEYLLEKGADVNQTYNGWSALIEAADEGSFTSMKYLLRTGANVNYYWTQSSPTAISMAASEGKLDCLRLLLENGADINGVGKSVPPLHIAAEEDQRKIIDYLISQKVSVNKKDVDGRTALMYAASEGHRHAVIKLIEAGANISMVDRNGATARDYAEEEDAYDVLDYLGFKKVADIHQLTRDGLIEKVQQMVERGTNVNSRDDKGQTPLHIASALKHNIDMRILIDLGANINAQDNDGRTPLMYAAIEGHGDAVALLVSRLADVNIQDEDGMTAHDWARFERNSDLANFLGLITENKTQANEVGRHIDIEDEGKKDIKKTHQERIQQNMQKVLREEREKTMQNDSKKRETLHVTDEGVHLRQFDMKRKTPELMGAIRNGSVGDCAELLNKGLSANTADDTGQTALMVAARTNRLDIAKLLIEKGADVNINSASGLTALHYAALENYDQMTRLLLKNDADVDPTMRYSSTDGNYDENPLVWGYDGATPLLIAVESGNTEVISILLDAGANPNHILIRNEYMLKEDRVQYLSGGEVMGLDEGFLKEVKFRNTDKTWTPYKQALLLNKPEILTLFPK